MEDYVGYWLAPLLLCLFILSMAVIGIVLCCKLRQKNSEKTLTEEKCNCKKTPRERAKSFLANSIFFTKSSEEAVDGPLYKQCKSHCQCNRDTCKHCMDKRHDSSKSDLFNYYNGGPVWTYYISLLLYLVWRSVIRGVVFSFSCRIFLHVWLPLYVYS